MDPKVSIRARKLAKPENQRATVSANSFQVCSAKIGVFPQEIIMDPARQAERIDDSISKDNAR